MQYFKGKTVWLTGASSGIGEAMAVALAEAGANLILSARRIDKLRAVAERCRQANGNIKVWVRQLDIADYGSFEDLVPKIIGQSGGVDVLINNAGLSQRSLAKDTELEVDKKLIEVNLLGTIALSKAVLPHFLERKGGHFVVVTSLMGKFGGPWRSSYAAAKHGLHGFFESLRAEVWRNNIYVTLLCPGFVKTDISLNALTADGSPQQKMDERTAAGLTPQQFAKKALKAIAKRKEEACIGKSEVMAVYLKRFLPGVFSKVIRKAKVK